MNKKINFNIKFKIQKLLKLCFVFIFLISVFSFVNKSFAAQSQNRLETGFFEAYTNDIPCIDIQYDARVGSRDYFLNGNVMLLQTFLYQNEYMDYPPTGFFSTYTQQALLNFQRAKDLRTTGMLDLPTRILIASETCEDGKSSLVEKYLIKSEPEVIEEEPVDIPPVIDSPPPAPVSQGTNFNPYLWYATLGNGGLNSGGGNNGGNSGNNTQYTITFNLNGGTTTAQTTFTVSAGSAFQSISPIKSGSTFQGWYTESNFQNQYNFSNGYSSQVYANINLWAKWTENSSTPTAPSGLSFTNVSTSSLTFNWASSTGATGYEIYWATGTVLDPSVSGNKVLVSGLNTILKDILGLATSTKYTFGIKAGNGTATSSLSATTSATTLSKDAITFATPTNLVATSVATNSITFKWDDSSNFDKTKGIYSLWVSSSTNFDNGNLITKYATTATNTILIEGLATGTEYFAKVMASSTDLTAYINSGWSATTSTTTLKLVIAPPPNTAPSFTTNLTAGDVTYTAGDTATALSVVATGNPTPTYKWQQSNDGTTFTDISGATSASYTPLISSVSTTSYRAIATNSAGTATSAVKRIIVKSRFLDNRILFSNITDKSITIKYSLLNDSANDTISIQKSIDGITFDSVVELLSSNAIITPQGHVVYTYNNLTSNTNYTFKFNIHQASDNTDFSATSSAKTLKSYTAPSGLVISNLSTTSLTLSWSKATFEGSDATLYVLRKATPISSAIDKLTTPIFATTSQNTLTYNFTGLTSFTGYNFSIEAVYGNNGTSSLSTISTTTKLDTPKNLSTLTTDPTYYTCTAEDTGWCGSEGDQYQNNDSYLLLTWNLVDYADSYELCIDSTPCIIITGVINYNIDSLLAGSHTAKVRAKNSNYPGQTSLYSPIYTFTK